MRDPAPAADAGEAGGRPAGQLLQDPRYHCLRPRHLRAQELVVPAEHTEAVGGLRPCAGHQPGARPLREGAARQTGGARYPHPVQPAVPLHPLGD